MTAGRIFLVGLSYSVGHVAVKLYVGGDPFAVVAHLILLTVWMTFLAATDRKSPNQNEDN